MNNRVRVWCLRHGEANNITTGTAIAMPDKPLTMWGCDQAITAAHQLAAKAMAYCPSKTITRIYTSTALRAQQSADLLATTLRLHVTAMPELVEVNCTAEVLRAWVIG